MRSFWPQYECLGDFHTHPYKNTEQAREIKGWQYSTHNDAKDNDYNAIESEAAFYINHGYRVGLVLTIALQKNKSKSLKFLENESVIEFPVGNYRLWLKGYIAAQYKDNKIKILGHKEKKIILDCPAIYAMLSEHTRFGKGIAGRGKGRIEHTI
jgi:hypothetical protein